MKDAIHNFIDNLIADRKNFLTSSKGLEYLSTKYSKDISVDEALKQELCSIYDDINSIVYLYITGKIVKLRKDDY